MLALNRIEFSDDRSTLLTLRKKSNNPGTFKHDALCDFKYLYRLPNIYPIDPFNDTSP